jgi:hypothetical protein
MTSTTVSTQNSNPEEKVTYKEREFYDDKGKLASYTSHLTNNYLLVETNSKFYTIVSSSSQDARERMTKINEKMSSWAKRD